MNTKTPRLVPTAIAATAAALAAVAITYGVARAFDADLRVTSPGADAPAEVTLADALLVTGLGGVIGLVLAALARRFTRRPALVFLGVCAVLLVLDGITPFTSSDSTSTGIWLNLMHLAAAIPIVGGLYRALPTRRDGRVIESTSGESAPAPNTRLARDR